MSDPLTAYGWCNAGRVAKYSRKRNLGFASLNTRLEIVKLQSHRYYRMLLMTFKFFPRNEVLRNTIRNKVHYETFSSFLNSRSYIRHYSKGFFRVLRCFLQITVSWCTNKIRRQSAEMVAVKTHSASSNSNKGRSTCSRAKCRVFQVFLLSLAMLKRFYFNILTTCSRSTNT